MIFLEFLKIFFLNISLKFLDSGECEHEFFQIFVKKGEF